MPKTPPKKLMNSTHFSFSLIDSTFPFLTSNVTFGIFRMHLRYIWILLKELPSKTDFSNSNKSSSDDFCICWLFEGISGINSIFRSFYHLKK